MRKTKEGELLKPAGSTQQAEADHWDHSDLARGLPAEGDLQLK